ncbi:hypothetical protein JTB14_037295 [Gonioctena quinquepunctata]|nr:hypothetical protein JTB14_037295 [Gonioctena quinquepunctata]
MSTKLSTGLNKIATHVVNPTSKQELHRHISQYLKDELHEIKKELKNDVERTNLQIAHHIDLVRVLTSGELLSKLFQPHKSKRFDGYITYHNPHSSNLNKSQSSSTIEADPPAANEIRCKPRVPEKQVTEQPIITLNYENESVSQDKYNYQDVKRRPRKNQRLGTNSTNEEEENWFKVRLRMNHENYMEPLIGVIDAGTRTVKFCVFRSEHTKEIAEDTVDITTYTPQEGWSEQDPKEILSAVKKCMENVVTDLGDQGLSADSIKEVGDYLRDKGIPPAVCEKLNTKQTCISSIKIGVLQENEILVMSPEFLPLGAYVNKFLNLKKLVPPGRGQGTRQVLQKPQSAMRQLEKN